MTNPLQDLRYAGRVLFRDRGSSAVAILALTLGIGANTAIFSVVDAVLLRPLPYRDPQRLVTLLRQGRNPVSPPDFLDFREQARSFDNVGAAESWGASLTGREVPEQVIGLHLSEDIFPMLGVAPLRGRTLLAEDFEPGKNRVVVIGYGLWQRVFGGSSELVGEQVRLDGESYTVIGVMPPDFQFTPFWITNAEMWAPLDLSKTMSRGRNSLRLFGRLRPGTGLAPAQAEVDQISRNLEAAYPGTNTNMQMRVESLTEKAVGPWRLALELMLGAVGMVLLIACANVANLTLARATSRRREIAIRRALGAPRSTIVRQFLMESLALAFTGGILGVILAESAVRSLRSILRPDTGSWDVRLFRWDEISLNLPVLLFTLALAAGTGILFGLAPAFASTDSSLQTTMKKGSRATYLRRALVVAEVAVSLTLMIGAGLLMRSFLQLRAIDPGFDSHNVLTMLVSVAGRADYVGPARESLFQTMLERVEGVPGVRQVSMINHLPLAGDIWGMNVAVEGRPIRPPGQEVNADYRVSRPDYFSTMRVQFVKGRDFTNRDTAETPLVAIINETLARREFPGENPVGRRFTIGDLRRNPKWITIVGVVKDLKQRWASNVDNEIYVPFLQSPFLQGTMPSSTSMTLVVRTEVDAETVARAVKSSIWRIDPNLPLSQVQTLEHAIGNATWQSQFSLLVIGIFAGLAITLAMVGVYGVMAYEVAQRTHEIGIRMALGAGRGGVLSLILGQSFRLAILGIACGLGLAAGTAQLMRGLLYQVSAFDPFTFAAVALLVLCVAACAAVIPARRATRCDPMLALRHE